MSSVPFYAIDTSCRSAECYHSRSPLYKARRQVPVPAAKQQEPQATPEATIKLNFIASILQNFYKTPPTHSPNATATSKSLPEAPSADTVSMVHSKSWPIAPNDDYWRSWVYKR